METMDELKKCRCGKYMYAVEVEDGSWYFFCTFCDPNIDIDIEWTEE